MVELKPSKKAISEIVSAARSLPAADRTYAKIRELTGYPTPLIMQALRRSRLKPKKIAAPKKPPCEVRPAWVEEVATNTGLDLIRVKKFRHLEEWLLLSPTGIPILRLVGTGDLLQSSIKLANPAGVLQGLSSYQMDHRKFENSKKSKT